MEKDKTPDEIFSGTGPEYEVWIHISTGLDMARQELDSLSEKERAILTKFAEQFFSQRTKLTVDAEETFAGLSQHPISQQLLEIPWLKFAADIAFAQEVDANVMTSRELQRTQCTANTLLERAAQQHLLPQTAEQAARDLIAKRNKVMHRRFENLKEDALKAMENLGIVLQYLGRLRASDA